MVVPTVAAASARRHIRRRAADSRSDGVSGAGAPGSEGAMGRLVMERFAVTFSGGARIAARRRRWAEAA